MKFKLTEDRIAIALLALLVIAAFANVVFAGRSLVPSENLNPLDHRDTVRTRGPNYVPPSEWTKRDLYPFPNYRDVVSSTQQYEPARELFRRSLMRGELPFWDPFLGGGNPSFATLIPAYLFPPSFIVTLLGNGSLVKNIYILLLILTSGVLTYFLLRRHGLSWQASIAGAVAFMLSGAVVQNMPNGLGQPIAFFSLPLLVTARLIDLPSARRAAQLALAFAFVALASFPPTLMQIFGICVVYFVAALIVRKGERRAVTAGWFAAGAAVSLAMVAVAYLPAVRAMAESTHIREFYQDASREAVPFRQIAQLLSPSILGGVDIYVHAAIVGPTGLHIYYTGVVVLFLGAIGFLAKTDTNGWILKLSAAIPGALALAKIVAAPGTGWINHVPFLRTIHYAAYFGILVCYCASLLAALGVDAIVKGRARRWHIFVSAGILLSALLLLRILAHRNGVSYHPHGWRWIADFRLLVLFSILAIAFAWIAVQRPSKTALALWLTIAVLGIEGITNAFFPRPKRWDVWRNPPEYVELLSRRNSLGRIFPLGIYRANANSPFRQASIDSIANFTSTRMYHVYKRYFCPTARFFFREATKIPTENVLDAANIEYLGIITWNAKRVALSMERGYEVLYHDDFVHLVRRDTTPRYTFTSNYRVAPTKEAALAGLETLPRGQVILEQPATFPPNAAPVAAEVRPRVVRFELNEVELAVDTPHAGLLVASETNMNGWTATVDGNPARILPANYAFRAVEVPPGAHTVRFKYRAPGFVTGLVVSVIGVLVCAFLWRRRDSV